MIGVTMGDANGVGPEIILRAFNSGEMEEEFLVIGDFSVIAQCNKILLLNIPLNRIKNLSDFKTDFLNVLDMELLAISDISVGNISEKTGYAALQYIKFGTQLASEKQIQALVTLPVNKEAIRLKNSDFSGHTGYIAKLCNSSESTMMLVSEKLIVTHVSTHVSQLEAIKNVKQERILDVIRLTRSALLRMNKKARIAVAGLNPHAGENNAFGKEDSTEILPAVEKARKEGIDVTGPVPADTVFYQTIKENFDAVVCMYHDQGHIPVKLLAFESAVNVTLGLPIVRTSVDHGTAFDIAWKGIASINSFVNAFQLAKQLI